MNRALVVYATLLIAALLGAYVTWTAEPEADDSDKVVVIAAETGGIERIVYTSEDLDLILEPREDEVGSYIWVSATKRSEKQPDPPRKQEPPPAEGKAADDGTDDDAKAGEANDTTGAAKAEEADDATGTSADGGATAEAAQPEPQVAPDPVVEVTEFKAGEKGDDLLEAVTPMLAKRTLAEVSDERLEEFGLAEPEATLTIERAGREPRSLDLGADVFGGSAKYVRDRDNGRIYLVDAKPLKVLRRGDRTLADKRLHAGKVEDVISVAVSGTAGSIELAQHNRDDREKSFWSIKGDESPNDTAKTWVNKVFRLRSRGYVQSAEQPTGLEATFTIDVEAEEGPRSHIELLRGQDPEGEEAWYARSDHTRGLVKLQRTLASEAAQDLAAVIDSGS